MKRKTTAPPPSFMLNVFIIWLTINFQGQNAFVKLEI